MSNELQLLTPAEAAKLLMVSPITLRQWSQKGRIPFHITPGGHRRYARQDIIDFASKAGMTVSNTTSVLPAQQHISYDNSVKEATILIVDDNKELCDFLKIMLEKYNTNWNIITANDGFEAGVRVQQLKPDIMIVDLNLPGINGDELCMNIKSIEGLNHIRLIGMSGQLDEAAKRQFIEAGAEVVLEKPIYQHALTNTIESILQE